MLKVGDKVKVTRAIPSVVCTEKSSALKWFRTYTIASVDTSYGYATVTLEEFSEDKTFMLNWFVKA